MHPSSHEIQERLKAEIAKEMDISREEIDGKTPFDRYGLDSMAAVNITLAMEDWLDLELSPNLPFKYPSISALGDHLCQLLGRK